MYSTSRYIMFLYYGHAVLYNSARPTIGRRRVKATSTKARCKRRDSKTQTLVHHIHYIVVIRNTLKHSRHGPPIHLCFVDKFLPRYWKTFKLRYTSYFEPRCRSLRTSEPSYKTLFQTQLQDRSNTERRPGNTEKRPRRLRL